MTIDIAHLRALLDKATPGPWEAGTAMCCPDMGFIDGPRGKGRVCPTYEAAKSTHTMDAEDAEMITALRNAAPALLDEVEALRARVALLDRVAEAARARYRHVKRDVHRLLGGDPRDIAVCEALAALDEVTP